MATEQPGDVGPQHINQNQRPGPPALSDEERKVMKECENESFFKRALPLSCGAILGVQYLVRTGKITGHPKFGALPKTIIAGGIAYFLGKVSYVPECRKKILEKIPDSNIALAIKRGQRGPAPDMGSQDSYMSQSLERDQGDHGNKLPTDTPSYEGISDSQRPSLDNEIKMPDVPEEKKSTTYEDLRQRNRQEYKDSHSSPGPPKQPRAPSYKDSPFMPQKAWPDKETPPGSQESPESAPQQAPTKRKRTNMWGDVIEE